MTRNLVGFVALGVLVPSCSGTDDSGDGQSVGLAPGETAGEVKRAFGPDFVKAIFALPNGQWSKAAGSAFGSPSGSY